MKQCRICGKAFMPVDSGHSRQFCFECVPATNDINARTIAKRRQIKKHGVQLLGGACLKCGETRQYLLDFHHMDKNTKDAGLANLISDSKVEKFFEEIQKCILLCSNCHREFHWLEAEENLTIEHYVTIPEYSFPMFSREYAFVERKYCACGKEIEKKASQCVDCFNLSRRTAERPDREELKQLIRTMPFTEIGKLFGVTDNAIRKWCDKEKLPTLKRQINSYSNSEWETI